MGTRPVRPECGYRIPEGLLAAMTLVSHLQFESSHWHRSTLSVLMAISSGLGDRSNLASILHYATIPHYEFRAWLMGRPSHCRARAYFCGAGCEMPNYGGTPESIEVQSAIRESVTNLDGFLAFRQGGLRGLPAELYGINLGDFFEES